MPLLRARFSYFFLHNAQLQFTTQINRIHKYKIVDITTQKYDIVGQDLKTKTFKLNPIVSQWKRLRFRGEK